MLTRPALPSRDYTARIEVGCFAPWCFDSPHFTHLPSSRCHTNSLTESGIRSRRADGLLDILIGIQFSRIGSGLFGSIGTSVGIRIDGPRLRRYENSHLPSSLRVSPPVTLIFISNERIADAGQLVQADLAPPRSEPATKPSLFRFRNVEKRDLVAPELPRKLQRLILNRDS